MEGCTDVVFDDGETRIICKSGDDVYLKDFREDFVRVGTYTKSEIGYSFDEDDEGAFQDGFSNRRRLHALSGKMYRPKKGGKRTKRRNNKKRSHKKRSHKKRTTRRR